jgi:phospholipid-translocating ATPase
MFLAVLLFNDSFIIIMSITFTSLIFLEFLNIIQEVTVIRRKMILSIVMSILLYAGSILFLNNLFELATFDMDFLLKVGVITMASWLPVWILKKLVDWYDPNAV